jgi:hypothetical protein
MGVDPGSNPGVGTGETMSKSAETILEAANAFIKSNLQTLCREMEDLDKGMRLHHNSKMGELRDILKELDTGLDKLASAHKMAVGFVQSAAIRECSKAKFKIPKQVRSIQMDGYTVEFNDSREMRDAVFESIVQFCQKHGSFAGESIMQRDDPQAEAPVLLSDICDDIIKFNECYED